MKKLFTLLTAGILFCGAAHAQFSTQNVITTNASNALDVFSMDLNNDGLKDVLSASSFE